jgi:hypothetical protein
MPNPAFLVPSVPTHVGGLATYSILEVMTIHQRAMHTAQRFTIR